MIDKFVWAETYRPKTVDELITATPIKRFVQGILDGGKIPNIILVGRPGIGKTTIAKLLVEQLGREYLLINASLNGNIDTLRTDIQQFASTSSFDGTRKYVILDEFDHSNPQSFQPALRGFIDSYVENCGFIFTANYENKIIAPLIDRCEIERFEISKADLPKLSMQFLQRAEFILNEEKVPFERDAVAKFIISRAPNWRSILNALQKYATANGTIDTGILTSSSSASISQLIPLLRSKDYNGIRKWVSLDAGAEPQQIYGQLFEHLPVLVHAANTLDLVVILARYQYQSAFVADQELNLAAVLAEIMINCEF
jgi:replication factor C small subunit